MTESARMGVVPDHVVHLSQELAIPAVVLASSADAKRLYDAPGRVSAM
ncbi:hypothetical protein [Methylomonas sp. MgM2]